MNENIRDFEIHGITGYTVMSNYHLRDPNLSLKAKGLLSMMLSMPKDWDYSIRGLAKISKEGRDAIKSILDELKESEYLKLEPKRDEKGHFRYKYLIYYLPYPKWIKMQNLSSTENPYSVEPISDKSPQINNKYKKDKIDKTPEIGEEIKHTIFTKELFKRNYISEDDSSSFLFDQLFEELLEQGNNYKDLLIMTNYVVSRIKERNFKDENDNEIKNKYGYFKNSILSNIHRFENIPDELYPDDEYDWLNDDENNFDYDWLNNNEEDLNL